MVMAKQKLTIKYEEANNLSSAAKSRLLHVGNTNCTVRTIEDTHIPCDNCVHKINTKDKTRSTRHKLNSDFGGSRYLLLTF